MQLKFKTGFNKIYLAFVIAFQAVIILLFTTKIYTTTTVGVRFGFILLFFDLVLILPMMFFTFYEFKEDYLYIHDYPLRAYKIKYIDIFNVEDGDFEAKNKKIVALSMDRVAIGYKFRTKDEKEEERYIFISPKDMSLFLIRLSGKLQGYELELEEKAKELSEKQVEHERMKKLADEEKKTRAKEKEPEIIKVSGVKKFGNFKAQSIDVKEKDDEAGKEPVTSDKK